MPPGSVAFYEVTQSPPEKVLPRLLEKIREAGKRVLVLTATEEQAEDLSSFLWTYGQVTFLAHGTQKDGRTPHQPILLTSVEKNLNNASVLITLDGKRSFQVTDYERCLDLFNGTQEDSLRQASQRRQDYLKEGATVTYWRQIASGQWEKAME